MNTTSARPRSSRFDSPAPELGLSVGQPPDCYPVTSHRSGNVRRATRQRRSSARSAWAKTTRSCARATHVSTRVQTTRASYPLSTHRAWESVATRERSNFVVRQPRGSRGSLWPLTAGVDMTSTVKYPGDARTGRAVAPLYIGPDAVDAGVIVGGAMQLWGGYRDSAPLGDRRL